MEKELEIILYSAVIADFLAEKKTQFIKWIEDNYNLEEEDMNSNDLARECWLYLMNEVERFKK